MKPVRFVVIGQRDGNNMLENVLNFEHSNILNKKHRRNTSMSKERCLRVHKELFNFYRMHQERIRFCFYINMYE